MIKGFSVYEQDIGSRRMSLFSGFTKRNMVSEDRKKSLQCSLTPLWYSDVKYAPAQTVIVTSLFQNVSLITRGSVYLAPRNRDLWEKVEEEPALVTAVTFSSHVPGLILEQSHSRPQCCSF